MKTCSSCLHVKNTRLPVRHANIVQRVKSCYKIKIDFRVPDCKRIRDAAFFLIIMLVTFAATLLKPQNYVSSRT
ncbi:hypothetical protein, partial [Prevotella sp.]|uniref:hypothetical protein n=1 Tax=Prevotella sp. TaxID=59823 RepID=UPI0025F654FE